MVPAIGSRTNAKIVTARAAKLAHARLQGLPAPLPRLPLTGPLIPVRANGSNHKGTRVVSQPAGNGADWAVLHHVGRLAQHPASPSSLPMRCYAPEPR